MQSITSVIVTGNHSQDKTSYVRVMKLMTDCVITQHNEKQNKYVNINKIM